MELPYNTDAEEALLGGMLVTRTGFDDAAAMLTVEDFTGWRAQLYATIIALHRAGENTSDVTVVMDALVKADACVTQGQMVDVVSKGSVGSVRRLADTVVRASVARKVMLACEKLIRDAEPGVTDGAELVMLAREVMGDIDAPLAVGAGLEGLSTVDEFLEHADLTPSPWIIPGLLRAGWRCMVIGLEGSGKSVMARQVALAAAQGVHPFTHRPIDPVRTLIVDLENPDDAIAETCKPITARVKDVSARYDEGRAWIYRRPEGIDLRKRSDRASLERVLSACRPDLVCLGPIYKAYRSKAGESDELAVTDLQATLDDFRTRYDFALLLEHHAPKATGLSGRRELVPHGTALWLRWPELGIKLIPSEGEGGAPKDSMLVGRFRFDRMKNSWPDRLDRGLPGRWPWAGYWEHGMDEPEGDF